MVRRNRSVRSELQLALHFSEIERLKTIMAKITDGRQLVITPSDPGAGGPTTPGVEPAGHVLYGSKHTRAFRVTDNGGIDIAFEQGQIWVGGTFFSLGAGTLTLTDNATNYVFVDNAGVVADNTTGFPSDSAPLAQVTTAAADITAVADRRDYLSAGIWDGLMDASQIILPVLGNPTFTHVEDLNTVFHSTGWITGGVITDAGGATIDVAAGTGAIRAADSPTSQLLFFDFPAVAGQAITADSIRYIGVEYNAGTPQVVIRTTNNFDNNTDFSLATVVNEAGTLHIQNAPWRIGDHAGAMIARARGTGPIVRDKVVGGLAFGETGTRNVTVSAGALWHGLTSFPIAALDTDPGGGADTFDTYSAGGLEAAGVAAWPNTQYDNAGVLATMTNNRYANLWWYLELDGELVMVYGTAQYTTAAQAEQEAAPSTLPNRLLVHGTIAARFIFQKSAATADEVLSAFETQFSTLGVTAHSNLSGLTADDHLIYALLAGRITGQTLIGGTGADEALTLQSTAHGTKGSIILGTAAEFELDEATGQLKIPTTGSGAGLLIGGEQIFRDALNSLTMPGGMLTLGEDTVLPGDLILFGSPTGSAEGGQMFIHLSTDEKVGKFDSWNLDVQADDLRWFQSSGQIAMLFKGHATTPTIEIVNSLAVKGFQLNLGVDEILSGTMNMYGALAGNEGAQLNMYLTAVHNITGGGAFDSWNIDINADDMRFFQSNGIQIMRFRGHATAPNALFPLTVYFDGNTFFKAQAAESAAPGANYVRHFIIDAVGRIGMPVWKDEASDLYIPTREAAALVPQAVDGSGGLVAGTAVSTTSAFVGLITVTAPITLDTITYNAALAGANADNKVRIALYTEDGQTLLVDEVDSVGTATGLRVVTLGTDVLLHPGNYYAFMCYESGTGTGPTPTLMGTQAIFETGGAGEPDLGGRLTVAGGVAPATFDPTAITTPGANVVPYFRFDGA